MLVSLGLDFRQARLEVRERFHLEDDDVDRFTASLRARGVREAVFARTCNRIEVYCWWPDATGRSGVDLGRELRRAWVGSDGPDSDALALSTRLRQDADAARHLFRVAAGLESQVLGDVHILGQLRRAFRDAIAAGSIGAHLHRLFETGLHVGKKVKRETHLVSSRNSVGAEAGRRAAARVGPLAGRTCVVVGCGKSGTHAARELAALGATDVWVANRTPERAERLAREIGGRSAGLDRLPELLAAAHVVVVAASAPTPLLQADALQAARKERPLHERLVVIDISVPRNVDVRARAIPGIELIDLDTLHPEAAAIERSRLEAVPKAEALVEQAVDDFVQWLELEGARRALRPLRAAVAEICRREVSFLAGASPSAERTAERIVARIMAHPMIALRAASERGESIEQTIGALGVLFQRLDVASRQRDAAPALRDACEGFPQRRPWATS